MINNKNGSDAFVEKRKASGIKTWPEDDRPGERERGQSISLKISEYHWAKKV